MYEGASHAQLAELAQRLAGALAALYGEMGLPSPDVGHVGGATYREQAAGELMSAVDMALRQAQQQGANAWRILETAMSGEVATASEWQGLRSRHWMRACFACSNNRSLPAARGA